MSMGPEFLAEWKAGYVRRRDRLVEGLRAAGFETPTPAAALYAFPKIPAAMGTDSRAAAAMLLDTARVATVPGLVFGPEGEGHLRFSFSVPEETIAEGMEALRTFSSLSTLAPR
jgi:aspartate aminotransferase